MHSVQSLQAEIADIRIAMAHEEFERVPLLLDTHDLHLREYAQYGDLNQDRDALHILLAMHNDVMRLMRERQRKLAEMIRSQRASLSASQAYARVGRI